MSGDCLAFYFDPSLPRLLLHNNAQHCEVCRLPYCDCIASQQYCNVWRLPSSMPELQCDVSDNNVPYSHPCCNCCSAMSAEEARLQTKHTKCFCTIGMRRTRHFKERYSKCYEGRIMSTERAQPCSRNGMFLCKTHCTVWRLAPLI